MVFPQLASIGLGLGSGFAFGTGYGAGVRFGYEDVYPYLKGNMSQIANMLKIPFASSGFKMASGVTERQGLGLTGADMIDVGPEGLHRPEMETPEQNPQGQIIQADLEGALDRPDLISALNYYYKPSEARFSTGLLADNRYSSGKYGKIKPLEYWHKNFIRMWHKRHGKTYYKAPNP